MSRPKGSINKQTPSAPETVLMSTEERIEFLANLIVDRIMEDHANGQVLLQSLGGADATRTIPLT